MINSFSDVTQDHLVTSLHWISKMGSPERWNLTEGEVAELLAIPVDTYKNIQHCVEQGLKIEMTTATVERLSFLLSIWKALQQLVPSSRPELAFAWFNKPNAFFNHLSIKEYLLQNNRPESFCVVIDYLDPSR